MRELSSGMTPRKTGTPSGLSRAAVRRASVEVEDRLGHDILRAGGELAFELLHLRIEIERVGIERAADDEVRLPVERTAHVRSRHDSCPPAA